MEQFMTEHGQIIVSGMISVIMLTIIFMIMAAVSNMEAYSLSAIMGA